MVQLCSDFFAVLRCIVQYVLVLPNPLQRHLA